MLQYLLHTNTHTREVTHVCGQKLQDTLDDARRTTANGEGSMGVSGLKGKPVTCVAPGQLRL